MSVVSDTAIADTAAVATAIEVIGMSMRFGSFTALDSVSIKIEPGTFHALLGENGAGKSTLVKCMMGFHQATGGEMLVNGKEVRMTHPSDAQELGLGMVYQHFTLVPSLTGTENLVMSRAEVPALIDWPIESRDLHVFMKRMPFTAPLDVAVAELSAGEKQKLELLKQLYLGHRFLILDEPTSVLTPTEADEILGHVRALTEAGEITVLMITHKFREVTNFADDVTVLRNGHKVGGGAVSSHDHQSLATLMMGKAPEPGDTTRVFHEASPVLALRSARAIDRSGLKDIVIDELSVAAGEVVGIAGISGNGQSELMEMLTGQRKLRDGVVTVNGEPYHATRAEAKRHKIRYLPEEPLDNACAPTMSVADNLAFRLFDDGEGVWLNKRDLANQALEKIRTFNIKTRSPDEAVRTLSGGNIQRVALARELSGDVDLLIVSNPCFGLDFASVSRIRERLMAARNAGVAVLLISEDLDELLELADRLLVMCDGRLTLETTPQDVDLAVIGAHMSGQAA